MDTYNEYTCTCTFCAGREIRTIICTGILLLTSTCSCSIDVLISVCVGGLVSGTMDDEVLCAQLAKIGGKKRKKQTKDGKFLVYSWSLTECIHITSVLYLLK